MDQHAKWHVLYGMSLLFGAPSTGHVGSTVHRRAHSSTIDLDHHLATTCHVLCGALIFVRDKKRVPSSR